MISIILTLIPTGRIDPLLKTRELVIFAYDFPPSQGGIARLCHEIAKNSRKYYQKITVLTRTSGFDAAEIDSLELIELPKKRIRCEWAAYRYLRRISKRDDVDVICGLWHPEGAIGRMAGVRSLFILGHGGEFLPGNSLFRKRFWLPVYARWVFKKPAVMIANSSFTSGLIQRINPKAKSFAVPLAVDTSFFSPRETSLADSKDLELVTVSRLQKHKGHLKVLEALMRLPDETRSRIRWRVAGSGPYKSVIEQEISRLGLDKQVDMLGFVEEAELPDLYRTSDVFVLFSQDDPSSNNVEGFGLVFLEAQACGIPVIGANTGGISDAVELGNGGWLLPQDDIDGLAALLKDLVDSPEKIKIQGEKARACVVNDYTWEAYIERLMEVMR